MPWVIQPARTTNLAILINSVDPHIYEHISESNTFEAAIALLQQMYVKPKSEVYARHWLATRHQETGETLDQFYQVLLQLSKNCNFQDVNALEH